jgi:hypothetical protein
MKTKKPDFSAVSGVAVAKILGIARRTHSDLVRKEILPPPNRAHRYDLAATVKAFVRYRIDDATPSTAVDEKRRVLKETADKLGLANENQRGQLIHVDHVAWVLNTICAQLAMHLDALPSRAVAALAGTLDTGKQRETLLGLTRDIRAHVADFFQDFPEAPTDLTETQRTAMQSLIGVEPRRSNRQ